MLAERMYRSLLSLWLLIGHGFPKLMSWFFSIPTWGAHTEFVPQSFFKGAAAILEFVGPLLIIIGLKVRWAAGLISIMLLSLTLKGSPFFHIRIPLENQDYPLAIIPSKEIVFAYGFAYLAIALFCRDKDPWWSKKKP